MVVGGWGIRFQGTSGFWLHSSPPEVFELFLCKSCNALKLVHPKILNACDLIEIFKLKL